MKIKYFIAATAVILAAASCQKAEEIQVGAEEEDITTPHSPITFSASVGEATKTIINDDRSVSWAAGDKIILFDAEGNSEEFVVEADCNHYEFTTKGIIGVGPYYAIAGYGNDTPLFDKENGTISLTRGSVVTNGVFGNSDVSAASSESTSLAFHHVYAIVKVSLATDDYTGVKMVCKGIAPDGGTTIAFDEDGALVIDYGKGGDEIAVEGLEGAGTYYMAVNPASYNEGFTFFIYNDSQMYKVSSSVKFTAGIKSMTNFGTLDTRSDLAETSTFMEESEWGVYKINSVSNVDTIYQYSEGIDQYSVNGKGAFRIQCLSDGRMASLTLSSTSLKAGGSCSASTLLYGLDGITDGAYSKSFSVKKVDGNKVWLTESGSDYAYIVSIK